MSKTNPPIIKNWVLTPHAAERINERNLSLNEIESVLKQPDLIKEQGPKFIFSKSLKNRKDNMIACVVLEKKNNNLWIVITVMHNFEEN